MFKVEKSSFFIVFEDGMIYMLSNDHDQGFVSKQELRLPFAKIASAIFEPSCATLLV